MTDADKPAFAAAFGALCIALREKEPDAHQLRAYFQALKELDIELVAVAADKLSKESLFFPKPTEWFRAARIIEFERQYDQAACIRARLHAGEPPLCGQCDDTGWERLEAGVKRCDCQKLRRLEILGRRPMPALPEAS